MPQFVVTLSPAVRFIGLCLIGAMNLHGYAEAQAAGQSQRQEVFRRYLEFGTLVKGGVVTPNWMMDGNSFWYAEGAPHETVIYKVDPAANTKTPLFDTVRLRRALATALGHAPPYSGLPFDHFAFVGGGERVRFTLESQDFVLDLASYSVERLPPPAPGWGPHVVGERDRMTPRMFRKEAYLLGGIQEAPESLSPDGQWFASLKDHNIWLRNTYDGREEALTTDGIRGYSWDVETVKWNAWSPSGLRLAVFKFDGRGMTQVPQIHWLKRNEEVDWYPITKAGGLLRCTEPYVIDILSKQAVPIDVGEERDQYITVIEWTQDGSELIMSRFSRDFHRVDILAADPETGETRVVLTETSPTFVKIQHEVIYSGQEGLTLLPDGKRFIWESERDGWNHLYLYDLQGNLIRQLTTGDFPVLDVVAVDLENNWAYFTAHAEPRLYDTHLYRVSLDGSGFERLTEGDGQHQVHFSPSKQYFVDTHSSLDRPPTTELRSADGALLQTLARANIDELRAVGWTPPEEFVVKAADGETDLWGVMHKPFDFDGSRRYPVVEYIYAGPQTVWVRRDFGAPSQARGGAIHSANLYRALPHLGYIVVSVDARGTPERSKAFHDVVYANWGRHEIADHAAAIRQLGTERPYLDLNRVGVYGASWGGHFAFRALAQDPELYRVGVVSVPGFDPYAGMLYEPYLGMPQQNKAAYSFASPFDLADKIEGRLLMVGNTSDHSTFRDVIRMAESLVRAGKQHDVMLLPNQSHGTIGRSAEFKVEGTVKYFEQYLKPHPN